LSESANHRATAHPFLFLLLALIFAVTPWPLGSNRDWAWPVITIVACLLTITYLFSERRVQLSRYEKAALGALALLCAWMTLQLFGIPGLVAPLTMDAFSTQSELLRFTGYSCVFFLTLRLLTSEKRIEQLLYVIVITGLLQALAGAGQQLVYNMPRATGSFANPNHYAGYLEVALSLGIGLIIGMEGRREISSNRFIELIAGPRGRLRLIVIMLVVGLVMSRSRMGNMGFLISLFVTSGMAFYFSRKLSWKTLVLLASVVIIDILIIGSYFGLERIGERLQNAPADAASRAELQSYNTRAAKDYLWTGSGAGSYELVMPAYRDHLIARKPVHAENDYLEYLIELGIIGSLPLILITVVGLSLQARLLRRDVPQFLRGISFGCMMGTLCLLIHATVDVNLQIPSNMLLFIILLAVPHALNRLQSVTDTE
jgi:O-antigen ligase